MAQANPASDGGAGTSTTRLTYPSSTQTLVADPTTNQSNSVASVAHTTYTIDTNNLVTSTQDQDGNTRSASYTPLGDVASSTNAAGGATTFSYPSSVNGGESLNKVQNPNGATESASYGNTGSNAYLPSSSTDDAGSALTKTYDTNGNQTSTAQGASGPQAKVTYNSDGTPSTSASPGAATGVNTSYAYANSDGDLTSITPPSGTSLGVRNYTWDGFGRLKTATDGKGDTTTYTYDNADRITNVAYSDSTPSVSYVYDANGHPTQRTDASGTTTYTYDDLGHLLTVHNSADGNTVTSTYDLAGALASSTDGLGTVTYTYDAAHQLTQMAYPQSGTTQYAVFANNSDGKRTDVWLQSNSTHTVWAAHEHYGYDTSGRITSALGENGPASSPTAVENETLCYTSGTTGTSCTAGTTTTDRTNVQWTNDTVSGEKNTYTYDDHNRLTKDVVTGGSNPRTYSFGYDVAGNRTSSSVTGTSPSSQSLTYNAANQITSTGYTYDDAGNLTVSPTRSATFNAAGQQTSTTIGSTTTTYSYAGTSNNEQLVENNPNSPFSYSYGRTDTNGQPIIDSVKAGIDPAYIMSDPTGQPIMLQTKSAVTCLYLFDGIGNPIGLSTSYSTTSYALRFDPYGASTRTDGTSPNGGTDANPYLFQNGIQDRFTHEIRFGQRYYNTTTGNWTQQDALNAPLDPSNANRYEYAADDPIDLSDPNGTCGLDSWDDVGDCFDKASDGTKKAVTAVTSGAAAYGASYACDSLDAPSQACYLFSGDVGAAVGYLTDKAEGD